MESRNDGTESRNDGMESWNDGMESWNDGEFDGRPYKIKCHRCWQRLSGRRQPFRIGNVAGGFTDATLGIIQRLAKPQIETVSVQNTLP